MKKLLAVLLIVALVLPLAASVAVAQDKPYIAIVSKGFQHQFWQVVAKGAQAAAEQYGVEITFDGPPTESDIAIQVDMRSEEHTSELQSR